MTKPFAFDSGNLALDFLNTRKGVGPDASDGASSPAALLEWLVSAGLLTGVHLEELRASPPEARILLAEAHRLRQEIRAAVDAMTRGQPAPERSLMTLNRVLESRSASLQIIRHDTGLALVEAMEAGPVRSLLSPVAEAAAHLLVDGDATRIRQCHADDCGWWFVDTSKNGLRKWCSMARCGNRAKAATHYRKHHEGSAPLSTRDLS